VLVKKDEFFDCKNNYKPKSINLFMNKKEERLENILIGVLVLAIVVISAVLLMDITKTITGKATYEYVIIGSGSVSGYCKEGCLLLDPMPINPGVVGNLIPINAPLLEVVPLPAGKYQIEFYGGEVGGRRFNVIWVLQSDEAGGDLLFLEVNQEDWGKTINMGEGFDVYEFKTIETDTIPPSLTSFKIVDYSGTQVPLVNNKYTMAGGNYYVDAVFSDNVALSAYSISIQKSLDNGVTWTSIGSCNKINLNSQTIDTYTSSTQDKGCAFTLPAGETGQIKFAVNLKDTSNNLASSGPYYYEMVSEPNIINPGLDSLTGWNVVKDSYTNTGPYVTPKSRIYTPNGYIYVYPKAGTNFVLLPYQSNAKQAPYFEQTITIPSSQAGTYELCAWGVNLGGNSKGKMCLGSSCTASAGVGGAVGKWEQQYCVEADLIAGQQVKIRFEGYGKTHYFGWDDLTLTPPPNGELIVFIKGKEADGSLVALSDMVFVRGIKTDGTSFSYEALTDLNTGTTSFTLPEGTYSISVGKEGGIIDTNYINQKAKNVVIEKNDIQVIDLFYSRKIVVGDGTPQLIVPEGKTLAVSPSKIGFIPRNSQFPFTIHGQNFDEDIQVYFDGKPINDGENGVEIEIRDSENIDILFTANDFFRGLIPEAGFLPLEDGWHSFNNKGELIFARAFEDVEFYEHEFSVAKQGETSITGKTITGMAGGDLAHPIGTILALYSCQIIQSEETGPKIKKSQLDCGGEKPHEYTSRYTDHKWEKLDILPTTVVNFKQTCVYLGYEETERIDECNANVPGTAYTSYQKDTKNKVDFPGFEAKLNPSYELAALIFGSELPPEGNFIELAIDKLFGKGTSASIEGGRIITLDFYDDFNEMSVKRTKKIVWLPWFEPACMQAVYFDGFKNHDLKSEFIKKPNCIDNCWYQRDYENDKYIVYLETLDYIRLPEKAIVGVNEQVDIGDSCMPSKRTYFDREVIRTESGYDGNELISDDFLDYGMVFPTIIRMCNPAKDSQDSQNIEEGVVIPNILTERAELITDFEVGGKDGTFLLPEGKVPYDCGYVQTRRYDKYCNFDSSYIKSGALPCNVPTYGKF